MSRTLPNTIQDETHLETLLSEPSESAVAALSALPGDVLILGAGGKMGPSFCRMLQRGSQQAQVDRQLIAVSRFRDEAAERSLNAVGIRTIRADLLAERTFSELPDAPNVVFMTGAKFGTSGNSSLTWAMNVFLPSVVCRRYRSSRLLVFSTGNVYPLVPVESGGSVETDDLLPVGEYAMSALGRERMFEYFSRTYSMATSIVRLNYAVEMRYGVVVDIAQQVFADKPVDVETGYANVIWQADANALAISALVDAHSPPYVVNVAGPERVKIRDLCHRFAERYGKSARTRGTESHTALLSNAGRAYERYGPPRVALEQIIAWTADWIGRGNRTWDKPTHFQVRDGVF